MKTGTREWSEHSVNIQVGCENGCRYCYAHEMAVRFKRCTSDNWQKPVITTMPESKRRKGVTMFPTTHDITAENLPRVKDAVRIITSRLEEDDKLLIVTKPRGDPTMMLANFIMNELPEGTMDKVEWRVTIGTLDEKILRFWEPDASTVQCRLGMIYFLARLCRFKTSVSIEPYLHTDTFELVKTVYPHADTIWIGRMNNIDKRVRVPLNDGEGIERLSEIKRISTDDYVRQLVRSVGALDKIRWKDSIKRVIDEAKVSGS